VAGGGLRVLKLCVLAGIDALLADAGPGGRTLGQDGLAVSSSALMSAECSTVNALAMRDATIVRRSRSATRDPIEVE
jgi:hypothetical protein